MPKVKVTGMGGARKEDFFEVTGAGSIKSRVSKDDWERTRSKLTASPVRERGKTAYSKVKIRGR